MNLTRGSKELDIELEMTFQRDMAETLQYGSIQFITSNTSASVGLKSSYYNKAMATINFTLNDASAVGPNYRFVLFCIKPSFITHQNCSNMSCSTPPLIVSPSLCINKPKSLTRYTTGQIGETSR